MCTIRRRLACCAIFFITFIALARPAAAQDTGIVFGTVIDGPEQVLPGATVTLTNENTLDARTATTNERGEFTFRAVQPGTYTVGAELAGFRKPRRPAESEVPHRHLWVQSRWAGEDSEAFIHNPIFYYSTIGALLTSGAAGVNSPPTIEAIEWDYKTPSSINWSAGVRRDVGWGTAVDATLTLRVARPVRAAASPATNRACESCGRCLWPIR